MTWLVAAFVFWIGAWWVNQRLVMVDTGTNRPLKRVIDLAVPILFGITIFCDLGIRRSWVRSADCTSATAINDLGAPDQFATHPVGRLPADLLKSRTGWLHHWMRKQAF